MAAAAGEERRDQQLIASKEREEDDDCGPPRGEVAVTAGDRVFQGWRGSRLQGSRRAHPAFPAAARR